MLALCAVVASAILAPWAKAHLPEHSMIATPGGGHAHRMPPKRAVWFYGGVLALVEGLFAVILFAVADHPRGVPVLGGHGRRSGTPASRAAMMNSALSM